MSEDEQPKTQHEGPCCDSCLDDYELGYTGLSELDGACCCRAVRAS